MRPLFSQLARIVDAGLSLAASDSVWPVLLVSASLGALLLLSTFRLLSRPAAIVKARYQMQARALELVLYRHDLQASTSAMGRTFVANGRYLISTLVPLAVSTCVLGLFFILLAGWLEWRPLRVGESTVVDVTLSRDVPVLETPLELKLSSGLKQTSDIVRVPHRNAALFRVEGIAAGVQQIDLQMGDEIARKTVAIGTQTQRVSCDRTTAADWASWFSPLEPALDDSSPIEQISIQMPQREIEVGSWTYSWLTWEVLIIGGIGLVLSRWFRVELF